MSNVVLKVHDLSFGYTKDKKILDTISIEFLEKKFYTILGTSGSGKTTFLSMIAGLEEPNTGEIYVGDTTVNKIGLENYRNKYLSMVFQGYNLINYMTALDNILSAMRIKNVKNKNNTEVALNMLERVGISKEQANQKVLTLSGGQQQRVAIARALASNNKLIIADEPTGNLDEKTSKEIIELFKNIVYNEGKTVIMVTHDKDISNLSDEVYVMKNKKLTKR